MADPALLTTPDPASFPPLPAARAAQWSRFGAWDRTYFPSFVGLQVEEIRLGYARMRLPWRDELAQPAGVLHGGAIATLVDTVVVPAIGAVYEQLPLMLTISMTLQYLGAVRDQDAVAEGWVVRRGRSTVFCEAAVRDAAGTAVATGSLVYTVRVPDGG
ncbi:MAG: PaaI family thioesterase [Acidimicrobiales bacterium]